MTVIKKPWGQEEVIEINDRYMVKKLTMWRGHRCSLQFHTQKQETIYVLSGSLKIYTGTSPHELSERVYQAHETITLIPGVIHRMEAEEDSVYLEASTPEMDDVVRLSDDYNRSTS
jgi:mannose-6-phosphate isomerase